MRNIKDKLCIMMPLKMRKYIEKYSHLFIGYKTKNIKKKICNFY
jgi:hypothetical protein